jgi:hypothetical protein
MAYAFHVETGDVIELDVNGELRTGLVLLINEVAAIIDLCDDSTPLVIPTEEFVAARVFRPFELAA